MPDLAGLAVQPRPEDAKQSSPGMRTKGKNTAHGTTSQRETTAYGRTADELCLCGGARNLPLPIRAASLETAPAIIDRLRQRRRCRRARGSHIRPPNTAHTLRAVPVPEAGTCRAATGANRFAQPAETISARQRTDARR
jgi:hypothetical protein